jgi:hypothetical protein
MRSTTSRGLAFLAASMIAISACHSASRPQPTRRTAVIADSIVLERTQSCFRTGPAYRVRLSWTGAVHFESRMPGDSGRVAEYQVDVDTAQALLARAENLGLEDLPADLLGQAHTADLWLLTRHM